MVLFNYSTKELTAKVVYYGPGLCGKTTNLQWIHEKLPIRNKGKMLSLATEADRTLFFDFLPIELGTIRGMKTRIQLYTVPGQVFYNATRRMVLKGADCVVFVADSQEPVLDANLDSMLNLRENLEVNEIDPDEIPMVLQYNKRDLPNALPTEILNERLNPRGLPYYEAVAMKGMGVEETLKGATALVFKSLAGKYGAAEPAAPPPAAVAPTPPVPTPSAPEPPASPPPAALAPTPQTRPPEAVATLPPVNATPPPADDLLESLDLQPAPEAAQDSGQDVPELTLDSPPVEQDVMDEIVDLNVAEAEAGLDGPPPMPPMATPPSMAAPPVMGRTTLVSPPSETEDLRRRIGRHVEPEMVLDEMTEEEEDIEEITFDSPSPPPAPPQETSPPPAVEPPFVPLSEAPTAPQLTAPPPFESDLPEEAGLPPEDTAPMTPPTSPAPALSVPVEVSTSGGTTDITVPVEVTLSEGTARIHLTLRIALQVKVL